MRRKYVALVAALATALALAVPAGAEGEADFTASPLTAESHFAGANVKSGETVSVIVQLEDAPLASYQGGVAGHPAPSPKGTKRERYANSKASRG
jgi:hypothetical protein